MAKIAIQGNPAGTGTITFQPPNTNTNRTVSLPDVDGTMAVVSQVNSLEVAKLNKDENIVLGASVAASGTAVDFVGIPAGVKRVTVMFDGVSTNGASPIEIRIGSTTFTSTGYKSGAVNLVASNGPGNSTSGFNIDGIGIDTDFRSGIASLCLMAPNMWAAVSVVGMSNRAGTRVGGGVVSIPGVLDRIRITTVNGTDLFDAGTINISWEY
jgi:hypothetical protein